MDIRDAVTRMEQLVNAVSLYGKRRWFWQAFEIVRDYVDQMEAARAAEESVQMGQRPKRGRPPARHPRDVETV